MTRLVVILSLIGFVGFCPALLSTAMGRQSAPGEVRAARLSGGLNFDGRVDEAAWDSIEPLELIEQNPTYRDQMSERTEIRIAYDDNYVYLSLRAFDRSQPTETTYRRDNWSDTDDQVAIALDTYNDHENSMAFVLYATGARIDAMFFNDARTMDSFNLNWNTFWDGLTTQDEAGWHAEIRIPISSLRFESDADGRVIIGVNAYRFIARTQEMYVYPDVPPDWGFWSFLKPSKGVRTVFDDLKSERPLYIAPYVIGGAGQEWRLNEDETGYKRDDEFPVDVGLDVKYGLTSNLTLDVSLNTDFAQVEADDQQVNLTRFSLFFPEKRQFFLERTSNFDFSFGGNDRVFYSRRIGIDSGYEIPLIGGARIVGRIGAWDVGALSMQSARHRPSTNRDFQSPSTNFTAVRIKRQVLNKGSHVGAIVTSRFDEDGRSNLVYGVDGVVNLTQDDYLRVNWAQTFDDDGETDSDRISGLDNARFRALLTRERSTGFQYEMGISRAGMRYRPGAGFQARQNFSGATAMLGWGGRPEAPSPVSSVSTSVRSDLFWRNEDGLLETAEVTGSISASTRSAWTFSAETEVTRDELVESFDLSDEAGVPAGEYSFVSGNASIGAPSGRPLQASMTVGTGGFYDGTRSRFEASPRWSPTPRFRLTGTYAFDRITFGKRDQRFDAHVLRLRADLAFNTRFTFSAFLQYNSAIEAVTANARFRYNPREGNDFYLVYNEGFNSDREAYSPIRPLSSSRTIIAKYTYTFLR